MKVVYREAAKYDFIRQFRYYLVTIGRADIATRFRDAVRRSVTFLGERPLVGARYRAEDPAITNVRLWPGSGIRSHSHPLLVQQRYD